MASWAAIEGIGDNGLRWRVRLPLKAIIPVVPEMAEEDVEKVALKIDEVLTDSIPMLSRAEIELPDFEFYFAENKNDLINALTDLYDWADYERVLIC